MSFVLLHCTNNCNTGILFYCHTYNASRVSYGYGLDLHCVVNNFSNRPKVFEGRKYIHTNTSKHSSFTICEEKEMYDIDRYDLCHTDQLPCIKETSIFQIWRFLYQGATKSLRGDWVFCVSNACIAESSFLSNDSRCAPRLYVSLCT